MLELVQPMGMYWDQVKWEDVSRTSSGPYESGLLKLNCDKALHYLKWQAVMGFEDTVKLTAEWFRNYYQEKGKIEKITKNQIAIYTAFANKQGLLWAK